MGPDRLLPGEVTLRTSRPSVRLRGYDPLRPPARHAGGCACWPAWWSRCSCFASAAATFASTGSTTWPHAVRVYNPTGWQIAVGSAVDAWNRSGSGARFVLVDDERDGGRRRRRLRQRAGRGLPGGPRLHRLLVADRLPPRCTRAGPAVPAHRPRARAARARDRDRDGRARARPRARARAPRRVFDHEQPGAGAQLRREDAVPDDRDLPVRADGRRRRPSRRKLYGGRRAPDYRPDCVKR